MFVFETEGKIVMKMRDANSEAYQEPLGYTHGPVDIFARIQKWCDVKDIDFDTFINGLNTFLKTSSDDEIADFGNYLSNYYDKNIIFLDCIQNVRQLMNGSLNSLNITSEFLMSQ